MTKKAIQYLKRKGPTRAITLRLSPVLIQEAQEVAKSLGISFQAFVEAALTKYFDELEQELKKAKEDLAQIL